MSHHITPSWLLLMFHSCFTMSSFLTSVITSCIIHSTTRSFSSSNWSVPVCLLIKLHYSFILKHLLLPHPGSATGHLIAPGDHHTLQHIQVHFGVDFQTDFKDVRWQDVALTWNHTKDHNHSQKLCFHHPVIHGNLDLHFEGAVNGPVVITWIGRDHELYSGASLISLVKHCHFQTW